MHEEQNNAPVKTVRSNRQEALSNLKKKENLKQFYLAQSRRLCPTVSVDRSNHNVWERYTTKSNILLKR